MKSSLLILAAGLFGMLSDARGDGFIVVERPFLVRPGHFPFAPLKTSLKGAKRHRGDDLKRQRSTSGYQPLDKIKC